MIEELKRIRAILSYPTGFEDDDQEYIEDARKAIDALIEQQPANSTTSADEPVAWRYKERPDDLRSAWLYVAKKRNVPPQPYQALYTRPQPAAWVGLTDEEANELWQSTDTQDDWELMKRTEAKLKEKNT